jgi:hypothetical protein
MPSQSINHLPEKLSNIIFSEADYSDRIWNIAGTEFGVCRWGSCQYSSACAFFDSLTILNKYLDTNKVFEILELEVDPGEPNPKDKIFSLIVEEYKQRNDDSCNDNDDDDDDDYKKIISCKSVDESFVSFKTAATLWTTMRIIFDAVYPNASITTKQSPGIGPILNQMVQSDNYRIGLMGWLLVKNGWVTNPDISFKGFDT